MKKISLVVLLLIPFVSAELVEDEVQGYGLEVIEFEDELGLVDSLIWNQEVVRNFNRFNGYFYQGFDADYYYGGNANFYGSLLFDDNSKVTYKITDFIVEETNVDEYGVTEAWGNGNFEYTLTITLTKSIPVEVGYSFYSADGYSDQYIYAQGDYFNFEAEGQQPFKHNRVIE